MSDSVAPPSTVENVLHELAQQSATGCLLVRDPEGDEAQVYLREGGIYAVNVPGRRAMLGVRLVSSGALTSEALAEALEVQRTQLEGWRLGELLIHLGYVEPGVVEASVVDHMTDALADLVGRPMAAWRFRKRKKTRQDTGPRTLVQTLFDDLRERGRAWDAILDVIGSTDAAPTLSGGNNDHSLEPNERSLLSRVDGRRSIADIAGECGFTLFEAGQVVVRLLRADLVQIEGAVLDRSNAGLEPDEEPAAEADRRAAEDKKRAAAERAAEARRKAEAKARAEADRLRVAAERRRVEAEKAEALELQRLAALRKQEQADRIRDAAAAAEEANERRLKLLADKRLEEAQALHEELQALAVKESAERAAVIEADKQAAEAAEAARLAADEAACLAQAAAEAAVGHEAERITREDAEQRAQAQPAEPANTDEDRAAGKATALSASNLLTQLSQGSDEVAALVPAHGPGNQEEQVEEPAFPQFSARADLDAPPVARQNDTAMLLRELSSLNFGDDDRAGAGSSAGAGAGGTPTPRVPDRPPVPPLPVDSKKKKRLFGR